MLREKVIKSPDAQLIGMLTEEVHANPGMIIPGNIETLHKQGFTIISSPGFHMGHIGINTRSDQTYRGKNYGALLGDVNFRHAIFHCYKQEEIVASIYKYIVVPVQSLVPPALGGWVNPDVPTHPYSPSEAQSILTAAGYTYIGAQNNWRTPFDFDGDTVDDMMPELKVFTPTYEVAPTSAEHGARWITECNNIGIPLVHEPAEFSPYITEVFAYADYDMYMVFWSLGRFPDHLYDMCHSSQDCQLYPWRYNAPGLNDPDLDDAVETLKFSLNHADKLVAAHEAQEILYDPVNYPDVACSYMQLYSRIYFDAWHENIGGIVRSPGYGSMEPHRVDWTTQYWTADPVIGPGGKEMIIYCLGEEPERLNPCYASTVYAWDVINPTLGGLIGVNSYSHTDLPSIADSWTVEGPITTTITLDSEDRYRSLSAGTNVNIVDGMKITYNLNNTVTWQDGQVYDGDDVEFNLEFLRNNMIPRYTSTWEHIADVQVDAGNSYKVVVYSYTTSQFLLYDFAGSAALLPPQVWGTWDGRPIADILGRDPSIEAGPQTDPDLPYYCPTNLYGTGAFIFVHYDPVGMYADLVANRDFWKTTDEMHNELVEQFHEIGDVDRDGEIWTDDKCAYGLLYGCACGDGCYDEDVDLNDDCIIDAKDGILISFYYGDKREYP
jgi:peptide/nickel transport system substrate-binding protein